MGHLPSTILHGGPALNEVLFVFEDLTKQSPGALRGFRKRLELGDSIVIKNVLFQEGFGEQLEMPTRGSTSIIKET